MPVPSQINPALIQRIREMLNWDAAEQYGASDNAEELAASLAAIGIGLPPLHEWTGPRSRSVGGVQPPRIYD